MTPEKGAHQIKQLLDEAKKFIPEQYLSNTPLGLKATAGLRMLGAQKSEAILQAVRDVFAESGFLTNEHSVEIMDGTDEVGFIINFCQFYSTNFLSLFFGT